MPLLAQQLDLTTALVFLLAVTTMDGIIALLIWNAHRRMTGLTMTAAGSVHLESLQGALARLTA